MNPYKNLIWEYSATNEKWYDATEFVEWIHEDLNSYYVKFYKKEKPLHISFLKIQHYKNPKEIQFLYIEHKGLKQYNVKTCLKFGDKYKLFFEKGHSKVCYEEDIKIYRDELKDNVELKNIFSYYKAVVQLSAKSKEDDFLLSQYDYISTINNESVLSLYLNAKNGSSSCPLNKIIICPFGTNLSQYEAIKKAFSKRISIIEGPPGTGKTQTILNFIANAVTKGYKVAVASNNNSAIKNVYEKLQKYGFDFLCALLGNKDNTDVFFENINPTIPDLECNKHENRSELEQLTYKLPKLFEKENEYKKLLEERDNVSLEHKHFQIEHSEIQFDNKDFKFTNVKAENTLKAVILLSENSNKKISYFKRMKIKKLIKCKKSFFKLSADIQSVYLQNLYFETKLNDINKEIQFIDHELKLENFDSAVKRYEYLSLISFKKSLESMFKNKTRKEYAKSDYKLQFDQFVKDFPVILSSTYALSQCIKEGFMFDYLIVDESSQVNMASAILSMRVAKNIIVVGDLKQLPQIDDSHFKLINDRLLEQYQIDKSYSYFGNSIMSSINAVFGDKVPHTLLKEHYRCNPEIIGFCNKEFYDGQLVIYTKNKDTQNKPLKLIKLVEGNHARKNPTGEGGFYSDREAEEINNLICTEELDDLGIISPYRIQTETISNKINNENIEVSTIHKFQGREKKNIILSTVVNTSNDFVDDPNMINVAVSRAIDTFTLVASDKVCKEEDGVLADLINYIKYHTEFSEVKNGCISSVFDILYSDYTKELEAYRKKHPSKDFDSENIIKNVIKEILLDPRFRSYTFSMHVSLKDIFRGKFIEMNEKEFNFFKNPWSHADFVIYNKHSRKPYAIIEVDGVRYHEQDKIQSERDALKDSIISKSGIKFLRLKTNESNEEERIINLLLA